MGWLIRCCDENCAGETWAINIDDLIKKHCDKQGWFLCNNCGNAGYVEKKFKTQEGEAWQPYLKGVICLGAPGNIYQPFVFLVSYALNEEPEDIWFSYYKDTRSMPGGKLKLGHGPGGPPVLKADQIVELVNIMIGRGCLDKTEVLHTLDT